MNYNKKYKTMALLKKTTALAVLTVALLSSCQKDDYYQTYVNYFSQDYTVNTKDWKTYSDNNSTYFYREFNEPNLTSDVYNYGVMQSFLVLNNGILSPLPFDDFWYITNGGYDRTEQVTCEFSPGLITFILKYSDNSLDAPYYDYTFRVRFMW